MNKTVSLKSILELHDSGTWGKDAPEDGISVLRSTNFTADGSISFANLAIKQIEAKHCQSKLLQPGDILIEKSGGGPKQPVGRVCLFMEDTRPHLFGNFIGRLRVNREVADPNYIFWYLWDFHRTGGTERYQKQTTGIRNLEFKRYLDLEVPLPPLAEQHRIVDILNRANGIRRLRREAQEKARQVIPALFVEMFGDPVANPKDYPLEPLPDTLIGSFKNGLYLPKSRYVKEGITDGVEMVHMSDAFYDQVQRGQLRRVWRMRPASATYRMIDSPVTLSLERNATATVRRCV